ncbi:MAG: hypothetical protein FJZ01_14335 [Candidatus Sericytochromatia bacterium]|nr:hypothetical protein [Candidatus Tanganyikabacteria bacterium]
MGRIIVTIRVSNPKAPDYAFECRALVDTGASRLVLPEAWRARLGPLDSMRHAVKLADQHIVQTDTCGPVRIEIAGFKPSHSDVVFLPLEPELEGDYLPLLGYIPLQSVGAAVDLLNDRLIEVPLDLRRLATA